MRSPDGSSTMQAWSAIPGAGLQLGQKPRPHPEADEVVVEVLACGVCRTDLHVIDGDLPVHLAGVTPGHQIVGRVVELGTQVGRLRLDQLVGIAWLRRTCGICSFCRSGRENLCEASRYTGWDADGGYAEFAAVPEAYAYPLPEGTDPVATAPLLCAGIIGYRALTRAALPPGGVLGLYGFGSSASLTAQLAMANGATVYAITRGAANQRLAHELGVAFVGDESATPPAAVDSAIIFAPAGELVPEALAATRRGGTVVSAGIHMSPIPRMDYDRLLFGERDLRSVTSNTRGDGEAFLRLAAALRLAPAVTRYSFSQTGEALDDLRAGKMSGSAVVTPEVAGSIG
jgi:propanol-preferring alcohol dehydrogenase